jgi:hypothetical protein
MALILRAESGCRHLNSREAEYIKAMARRDAYLAFYGDGDPDRTLYLVAFIHPEFLHLGRVDMRRFETGPLAQQAAAALANHLGNPKPPHVVGVIVNASSREERDALGGFACDLATSYFGAFDAWRDIAIQEAQGEEAGDQAPRDGRVAGRTPG